MAEFPDVRSAWPMLDVPFDFLSDFDVPAPLDLFGTVSQVDEAGSSGDLTIEAVPRPSSGIESPGHGTSAPILEQVTDKKAAVKETNKRAQKRFAICHVHVHMQRSRYLMQE